MAGTVIAIIIGAVVVGIAAVIIGIRWVRPDGDVNSRRLVTGRILAVVATLVVNELVRVVYRGVGPVFASPAFCGVGC